MKILNVLSTALKTREDRARERRRRRHRVDLSDRLRADVGLAPNRQPDFIHTWRI